MARGRQGRGQEGGGREEERRPQKGRSGSMLCAHYYSLTGVTRPSTYSSGSDGLKNPQDIAELSCQQSNSLHPPPPVSSGATLADQDRATFKQAHGGQNEQTAPISVMKPCSHWMSAIGVVLKPCDWAQATAQASPGKSALVGGRRHDALTILEMRGLGWSD